MYASFSLPDAGTSGHIIEGGAAALIKWIDRIFRDFFGPHGPTSHQSSILDVTFVSSSVRFLLLVNKRFELMADYSLRVRVVV